METTIEQTRTIQNIANEILAVTEKKTRGNGDTFHTIDYDRLEYGAQLQDAVRLSHGDKLPNDWIYDAVVDFLNAVEEDIISSSDDIHEWADNAVNVYDHDLLIWAVDHKTWIDYATEEFGIPTAENFSFMKLISLGQYYQMQYIANTMLAALEELTEQ